MAMNLAMMAAAQGYREVIADLAAECAALCKAQVVGIRRLPAAYQAWLLRHVSNMLPITNPARLRELQHAFVDCFCRWFGRFRGWFYWLWNGLGWAGLGDYGVGDPISVMDRKAHELGFEGLLDMPRIGRRQSVLVRQGALGPERGGVGAPNVVELGEEPVA